MHSSFHLHSMWSNCSSRIWRVRPLPAITWPQARLLSTPAPGPGPGPAATEPFHIHLLECSPDGQLREQAKDMHDLIRLKNDTQLPIRDMRMFFASGRGLLKTTAASGGRRPKQPDSRPAILARPSSKCFLLNLEHIRLLCLKDRCLILHPEENAVKAFAWELRNQLSPDQPKSSPLNPMHSESSMHSFLDSLSGDRNSLRFELVVLETCLSTVTRKFRRHLNLLHPVLDLLLRETSSNPSAAMLRRMLAFRKSLNAFEMSVTSARKAVSAVLKEEQDMQALNLSVMAEGAGAETEQVSKDAMEEIELLLETYNADLKELESELQAVKEQIEDTNDFLNIHLNSIRNRIIRMSLFMEMGTLAVGTGALCAGAFGMNLTSGLESHPTAFFFACGGIALISGSMFAVSARKYSQLERDSSSARSYQALRNFFNYVENVENAFHSSKPSASSKYGTPPSQGRGRSIDRKEFHSLLEPVVGTQLSVAEIEEIFHVLDENRDGTVDMTELTDRIDHQAPGKH